MAMASPRARRKENEMALKTQVASQFLVSTSWRDEFKLFLEQDYRRFSPTHRVPSENSIKAACQHIRVFSMWWEAEHSEPFSPERITSVSLRAYQRHSLEVVRVRPDTWNSRLWALRIFAQWIQITLGDQYAGLADDLHPKEQGVQVNRYRSLTPTEIRKVEDRLEFRMRGAATIFEYQNAMRDYAAIMIMLRAGLRVEEASLLDASDITIKERSGQVRVRNGKGSKERVVPLGLEARHALAKWMDVRPTDAPALFPGGDDGHISTRQLQRIVSELGTECGIDGMSPHWLRFTFAKMLERSGASIEIIRNLLGHESIDTTRRYLRSSFDELQTAVEGI